MKKENGETGAYKPKKGEKKKNAKKGWGGEKIEKKRSSEKRNQLVLVKWRI